MYHGSDVHQRYEAIRTWNRLLTSSDSEYWVQLIPGTVVGEHTYILLFDHSLLND
jgi:trimethyllysine dioxygenase